jgi:hypothetical protein
LLRPAAKVELALKLVVTRSAAERLTTRAIREEETRELLVQQCSRNRAQSRLDSASVRKENHP